MARTKGALGKKTVESKRAIDAYCRKNGHRTPLENYIHMYMDESLDPNLRKSCTDSAAEYYAPKLSPQPPEQDKQEQSAFEFTWIDDPLNAADNTRAN